MIKREDETWTTIQCNNLKGDNGEKCDLCFKVLNDRFALVVWCPYCLQPIDMHEQVKAQARSVERKYKGLDPFDDELAKSAFPAKRSEV